METGLKFYSDYGCDRTPCKADASRFKKENPGLIFPCMAMMRFNIWNDHSFYTHFVAILMPNIDDVFILGPVKIIQSNAVDSRTKLPEEFYELPKNEFFSRGTLKFYNNLNKLGKIKDLVLSSLNDVHFHSYTKEEICKVDPDLSDPYDFSLYRSDFVDFNISSEYAQDSKDMLHKISSLADSVDSLEDHSNREVMIRLLYGSVITCLESYLGDAFRYHVFNNKSYFQSFLKNYEFPKGDKKYSWRDLGLKGDKIGEFIEDRVKIVINDISFHNLEKINSLYKNILNVDLPRNWVSFNDNIQKRHDIFHRNGKTVAGNTLVIKSSELRLLIDDVMKFIGDVESVLLAQL